MIHCYAKGDFITDKPFITNKLRVHDWNRRNETEIGMNGSKDWFSACSAGTSMMFAIKFSGLLVIN